MNVYICTYFVWPEVSFLLNFDLLSGHACEDEMFSVAL